MAQILGALTAGGGKHEQGMQVSKGGQECSEKRPQMGKLGPSGEAFPADFIWSFVTNFPTAQRGGEPKPATELHNPTHGFTAGPIDHGKLCRKSVKNSCTPQKSHENAAGIISILLLDKLL